MGSVVEDWHVVVAPRPATVDATPGAAAGGPPPMPPPPFAPPFPPATPRPADRLRRAVAIVLAPAVLAGLGYWRADAARATRPIRRYEGVTVRPATGGAWAPMYQHADGEPVRWNPCDPIHVVANLDSAPFHAGTDITEALARLSAATGMRFVYDGPTDEAPRDQRPVYQPERYGERWAPVLLAWYPFSRTDLEHHSNTAGLGGPSTVPIGRRHRAVSGQVLLNSERPLPSGFDSHWSWGMVLLHELGHALGLAHVDDPGEIMYDGPVLRPGPADWGPGDLAGLHALGRQAGCFDLPSPRSG